MTIGAIVDRMTALDDALKSPKGVQSLDLSGLGLTALPDGFDKLRDLTELDISNNRFEVLPAPIVLLPRLRTLIAHGCGMSAVPHGFPWARYVELQLGGNPIRGSASTDLWTLPMMIAQCPTLEVLGIDAYSVKQPGHEALRALKRLKTMHVYGKLTKAEASALAKLLPETKIEIVASAKRAIRAPAPKPIAKAAPPPPARRKPTGDQAKALAKISKILAKAGVDEAALAPLIRPSVHFISRAAKKKDTAIGATRLGGEPDLAPGVAWPLHDRAPMEFLAQIRLEDVAQFNPFGALPAEGLLSFFARDMDYGAVLWAPDASSLVHHAFPKALEKWGRHPACGLDPHGEIAPPVPEELGLDPKTEKELYAAARPQKKWSWHSHQMLGWRYDPDRMVQLPEQELLFAFNSDDRADMNFGDAGRQYFYIDVAKLAARDFSDVLVTCGN